MGRYSRAAVAALLLSAAGITALSQQASAVSLATLHVDRDSPTCSDSGPGSPAVPFCTIQAAANLATAGDTVVIGGSNDDYANGGYNPYDENVTVTHSGTRTAPITFEPEKQTYTIYGPTAGFTVKGDYVDIIGATVASQRSASIVVSGSHDTIDGAAAELNVQSVGPTISVLGDDTTIERSRVTGYGANVIELAAGAADTVVTTDIIHANGGTAIDASGARNAVITSNSIEADCANGISLAGSTLGADVHNNIVGQVCPSGSASKPTDLIVGRGTTATTSESYNILSTSGGTALAYSWAGAQYTSAAAFQKATGQGTADLVESSFDFSSNAISADNPAIDSADSNAPGELATDIYGNARVDNPAVPNTGAGQFSYYDRGAIEYQEYTAFSLASYFDNPQRIALIFDIKGIAWGPNAEAQIDWGDGSSPGVWQLSGFQQFYVGYFEVPHVYAQRGTYTVTAELIDSTQTVTRTTTVATTGSTYLPVTPTRVLDTRTGLGAPTAKVGPNSTITVDAVGSVPGAPPRQTITAVVVNVTVTDESEAGYITAYPDGRSRPATSNVNFKPWPTTAGLVTVKVADGRFDLFNGSAGSIDLIGDVQGYYVDSAAGNGYVPLNPVRIIDTRAGFGGTVVQPDSTLALTVEGAGGIASSGVAAVALNVTAMSAGTDGYLNVYADGSTEPQTSTLNYGSSRIVQNLVVAKVGADGKIALHNRSRGTVQLIADVAGYYPAASGGHAFIPVDPVRMLDTRDGTGQQSGRGIAVAPMSNARWPIAFLLRQNESALVVNVTATQPQATGYIIAYPGQTARPATSNLDFVAGQTVANLVMSRADAGSVNLFNSSTGSTQLIADVFGFFS